MNIEVFPDAESVAREAAQLIAEEARTRVALRGKFVMAVSGGKTPWMMLRNLANEDVPWNAVHVFQVDERITPAGDPDRNLTHLRESLLTHAPLRPEQIYGMPVESGSLESACAQYALTLEGIAGSPPTLAAPRPRTTIRYPSTKATAAPRRRMRRRSWRPNAIRCWPKAM